MTYEFRPAVRENVGLLIGLAGGTGSGKTMSALRLAAGISGGKPFAVIDTEARRALHYADKFKFEHCELKPPFRPQSYADAIAAADSGDYPVIVVDSASHEHAGEGGLLDWHEEEFQRMGGRDAVKMTAWIKPKTAHKHMVNRLLQVRAHLILCFRAEEKVEMRRGEGGKMEIGPKVTRTGKDGWVPICEKNLPFEMTCSFLLLSDKPGYPNPIKLEEQHKGLFPLDKPIGEDAGRAIAAWAAGGDAPRQVDPLDALRSEGKEAAEGGLDVLAAWWKRLPRNTQTALQAYKDETLKPIAAQETMAGHSDSPTLSAEARG